MRTKLTKKVAAIAIGLALGGPGFALAAPGVLFDVNGAAGPNVLGNDRFYVSSFDWNVGNVVATDTTPVGLASNTQILAQSILSILNLTFGGTAAMRPGAELTFQLKVGAVPSSPAAGQINWDSAFVDGAGDPDTDPASYFVMYYDATADSGGVNSTTGCGFGLKSVGVGGCVNDGSVRILEGQVTLVGMNYGQQGTNTGLLDQFGGDDQNGVRTVNGNGNGQFDIDVFFADPAFFLSDITTLHVDMTTTSANPTPFTTANPTDVVVDRDVASTLAARQAAYGTDLLNNIGAGSCPQGGACDFHMQGDASTAVRHDVVPEPATLALLGLGLAGLGLRSRRRNVA